MEISQKTVTRYLSSAGAQIFQIPLNGLEDFWVYAYLVSFEDMLVLIDTGTNYHTSNQDLDAGLISVGEHLGRPIGFEDLTHVFITHGHIDHYAGLAYVAPKTQALIGVHEYDYPIVANYHERKERVVRKLKHFLIESGVKTERIPEVLDMYMITKGLFKSSRVDFTYEAVGMRVGPFEFFHVPGHSAGAVAIRLHDVLFVGDHVLSDITPHQAPESFTLNTGLTHYLDSLRSIVEWAGEAKIVLGGHNSVITDLRARVEVIYQEHYDRLVKILELIEEHPRTVLEISKILFGKVAGFTILLALEEAGAHMEYLYRLGFISIKNIEEVRKSLNPVTLQYQCFRDKEALKNVFPKL